MVLWHTKSYNMTQFITAQFFLCSLCSLLLDRVVGVWLLAFSARTMPNRKHTWKIEIEFDMQRARGIAWFCRCVCLLCCVCVWMHNKRNRMCFSAMMMMTATMVWWCCCYLLLFFVILKSFILMLLWKLWLCGFQFCTILHEYGFTTK